MGPASREEAEMEEKDKREITDTETLREKIRELEEALEAERALDDVYAERLRTVEEIRQMKFARLYREASVRLKKGDPFDAVRRKLRNHEGIHVFIGSRIYGEAETLIRGWALDPDAGGEFLRVRDRNGARLICSVTRHVRPDVNQTFHLPEDRKAGFEIRIPARDYRLLPVTLEAESARGMCTVPLNVIPDRKRRIERWQNLLDGAERSDDGPAVEYDDWAYVRRPSPAELVVQKTMFFEHEPLISIVIPLYETPENYLRGLTDSLIAQSYRNFEICFADGSGDAKRETYLKEWYPDECGPEGRIRYRHLPENLGISGNTNAAIGLARGEYLMLCDHDDVVEPDALYEIVREINRSFSDTDLIYTDEDKLEADGGYLFDPFFKPDYDRDLLESYNYFTHIVVIRRETAERAGLFRSEYDGAQDYDFLLRCAECARRIAHVPRSLYHWRAHELSTAGNPESKLYAYENGRRAVEEHLKRTGVKGTVQMTPYWGRYRTVYRHPDPPKVTVLHFTDTPGGELLPEAPIEYPSMNFRAVQTDERGPAHCFNIAAREADGDLLLFMRSGAAFRDPDALSSMAGLMQRPEIGCVGARIVSRDGRIVSAGWILGIGGSAAPAFNGVSTEVFTYGGFGNLTRGVSGVSCECMLVRRDAFIEAGGFDETYESGLFDLDLCLTLSGNGLKTVMVPFAQAELPAERDGDAGRDPLGTDADRKYFHRKWAAAISAGDPFYNPNLTLTRTDCSLDGQYA